MEKIIKQFEKEINDAAKKLIEGFERCIDKIESAEMIGLDAIIQDENK